MLIKSVFCLLAPLFVSAPLLAATRTSVGSGEWNTGATWSGGVVPTATDDVIIANGHNITLSTPQGNCLNLTVNGTLTSTIAVDCRGNLLVSGTFIFGANSYFRGNAEITPTGVFNSAANGNRATFYGSAGLNNVILTNNGQFGEASGTTAQGPALFVSGDHIRTFRMTGTGTARFQGVSVGDGSTGTLDIAVDQDWELRGTGGVLSVEGFSKPTSVRSLTINAGKTVVIKAGWFHIGNNTNNKEPTGNHCPYTYNINGTLDVSSGRVNLSTTSSATVGNAGTTQSLLVEVGPAGLFKMGGEVYIRKAQATQSLDIIVNAGGRIDGSGIALSANSTNIGAAGPSWFSLADGSTYSRKLNGTTATNFWVGTSSGYNPVQVTTGGTEVLTVGASGSSTNPLPQPGYAIGNFWTITPSVPVAAASLAFGYNDSQAGPNADAGASMVLARYNPGTSLWDNLGSAIPAAGTGTDRQVVYSNVAMDAGGATYAIGNASVLPVKLKDYTAKLSREGAAELKWTTATETSNDYFILSRSTDGINFDFLARIEAKGPSEYTFVDANPLSQVNYYRLAQVDTDGETEVLGIATVKVSLSAADLKIYPNPVVNNQFTVSIPESSVESVLRIYNLTGNQVYQRAKVKGEQEVNVGSLASGTYIVNVNGVSKQLIIK